MLEEDTPELADVVVVTPWYPVPENPMWGTFVVDAVNAMNMHLDGERIIVVHVDGTPTDDPDAPVSWSFWEQRPEAEVLRIRAPHDPMVPRAEAIRIHREALREHALPVIRRARILSAHVGGPTGAAVGALLHRRTRFTITEHATYVRALFRDTEAAVQYRAAVARSQRVLAVSDETAAVIRRQCSQQSDIVSSVPNPVRFDDIPLRAEPVRSFDRWLFIGNLVERKGVDRLLESFIEEYDATGNQALSLTIIGDGPLRESLHDLATRHGVSDRVHFLGTISPSEVAEHLTRHDVLVHLSRYETFGITLVEAAAAGLPVVVTRCGGPEETMIVPAGHGTAVIVQKDPPTDAVRAGIHALRTDVTTAELATVREVLRSFYGFERVADLLHKYVLGTATPAPFATPLGLNVLIIFQGPAQWQRARHGADRAVDMGANVTVVDMDSLVTTTPAGVSIVTPGGADRHNGLRTLERTLVDRAPRALLRRTDTVAQKLPAKYGGPLRTKVATASRAQQRAATWSETRVYHRIWGVVRGYAMARRIESQPELRQLENIDVIVHMGGRLTQPLYRFARRFPDATIHHGAFNARNVAQWWLTSHPPAGRAPIPEPADEKQSVAEAAAGSPSGAEGLDSPNLDSPSAGASILDGSADTADTADITAADITAADPTAARITDGDITDTDPRAGDITDGDAPDNDDVTLAGDRADSPIATSSIPTDRRDRRDG